MALRATLDPGRSGTGEKRAGGPTLENDQLAAKALRVSVATARTDRIATSDQVDTDSDHETAMIDHDDIQV